MSIWTFSLTLILSSLFAIAAMTSEQFPTPDQKNNPYLEAVNPEGRTLYTLNLRIINNGVTFDPETLKQQINAVEKIYSQCDGVNFKVIVTTTEKGPPTTTQDHFIDFRNGQVYVNAHFFSFFTPWYQTRKEDVMDIHIVDFFTNESRVNDDHSVRYLGQAFQDETLDWAWLDPRDIKIPSLSELAANTAIVAFSLLEKIVGEKSFYKRQLSQNKFIYTGFHKMYKYTLLAHEIAHSLFETQKKEQDVYKDHYCPYTKSDCSNKNLLSAGGYYDLVFYKSKKFKKIIGYSKLPEVDPYQCAALKAHPLVNKN